MNRIRVECDLTERWNIIYDTSTLKSEQDGRRARRYFEEKATTSVN